MKLSIPRYWRRRFDYYNVRITECLDCGKVVYPKKHVCPYCRSLNVRTVTSSGIGEVITYTVSYYRMEGDEDLVPRIVALIKLSEGPSLIGELVDVGPSEVREGLKVEAVVRRVKADDPSGLIYYGVKFRPLIK